MVKGFLFSTIELDYNKLKLTDKMFQHLSPGQSAQYSLVSWRRTNGVEKRGDRKGLTRSILTGS